MNTAQQLSDFPHNCRIALFGAGEVGVSLLFLLKEKRPDISIVCFIDSYKKGYCHGVNIIKPAKLQESCHMIDLIVITSFAFSPQIAKDLDESGITNYCCLNPLLGNTETNVSLPKRIDTLYAFYDRSLSPDGFDIILFLCLAELKRNELGCHSIHVVIVPKPDNLFVKRGERFTYGRENDQTVRDDSSTSWFERNVLVQCCWMLPSCKGVTLAVDRSEAGDIYENIADQYFPDNYSVSNPVEGYSWAKVVAEVQKNQFYPPLRSTPKALDYISRWIAAYVPDKKIVSITLRESNSQKDRNSNIEEWLQFAQQIKNEGYEPVIIRDTATSFNQVPKEMQSFLIFQAASWNMELRMACYELSYINMFTAGGPSFLAQYNKNVKLIRFLILRNTVFECSKEHYEADGIIAGTQFPGAMPYQITIWEEEKHEIMLREFHKLCLQLETR